MKSYSIVTVALLALFAFGSITQAAEKGKAETCKVEEIFAKKDKLNGKMVTVKGKVVKFNAGIMGRNWIHIQDGSGKQGTNDITVTTDQNASVGDTVVATGKVAVAKDFGGGYKYEVIIEDGTVKAEKK